MSNIILYVIHNEESYLNKIVANDSIKKFNLNKLSLDKIYQRNELAENRFLIYLSKNLHLLEKYDYIGICAASWNEKYKTHENQVLPIEKINTYADKFKKGIVYVAAPVFTWYEETINNHQGMEVYLKELLERNNFKKNGTSFYSNNFVCSKRIMIDFLKWWKIEFEYFFKKHGINYSYNSSNFSNYKPHVNCAYFYERLTISYFANKKIDILKLHPENFKSTINNRNNTIRRFNTQSKLL